MVDAKSETHMNSFLRGDNPPIQVSVIQIGSALSSAIDQMSFVVGRPGV